VAATGESGGGATGRADGVRRGGRGGRRYRPPLAANPPIRSRYGPRRRHPAKLHADKGYDFDHLRSWLRRRQIVPRRPTRQGVLRRPGPAPLGDRAHDVLAEGMPPPAPSPRAQSPNASSPSSVSPAPASATAEAPINRPSHLARSIASGCGDR
jgi:hypothetical protein